MIEGFRRVECECPLDVTGLEGFLLVFLGRAERELRGVAYETLHILAKLLRVLPPFVASTPPQTVISLMTRFLFCFYFLFFMFLCLILLSPKQQTCTQNCRNRE